MFDLDNQWNKYHDVFKNRDYVTKINREIFDGSVFITIREACNYDQKLSIHYECRSDTDKLYMIENAILENQSYIRRIASYLAIQEGIWKTKGILVFDNIPEGVYRWNLTIGMVSSMTSMIAQGNYPPISELDPDDNTIVPLKAIKEPKKVEKIRSGLLYENNRMAHHMNYYLLPEQDRKHLRIVEKSIPFSLTKKSNVTDSRRVFYPDTEGRIQQPLYKVQFFKDDRDRDRTVEPKQKVRKDKLRILIDKIYFGEKETVVLYETSNHDSEPCVIVYALLYADGIPLPIIGSEIDNPVSSQKTIVFPPVESRPEKVELEIHVMLTKNDADNYNPFEEVYDSIRVLYGEFTDTKTWKGFIEQFIKKKYYLYSHTNLLSKPFRVQLEPDSPNPQSPHQ